MTVDESVLAAVLQALDDTLALAKQGAEGVDDGVLERHIVRCLEIGRTPHPRIVAELNKRRDLARQ